MTDLRDSWEKNWPEVRALLTGSFPKFVLSGDPPGMGSEVPVFCYHLVGWEEFERDLKFLSRNDYDTIDAQMLLDHITGVRRAPPRSVVLTIDDGAQNLFDVAFPLLRRYGMKAVAFIAPGLHQDATSSDQTGAEDEDLGPCDWSEIQLMHESGTIDFQAHTFEHRYVPRWPEPASLTGSCPALVDSLRGPPLSMKEDFELAKRTIEERLGKRVLHLAFPRYRGTTAALELGVECGFQSFWWGYVPGHLGNRVGQSPHYVARTDGIYLRRLPGEGRLTGGGALKKRLSAVVSRQHVRREDELLLEENGNRPGDSGSEVTE